VHLIESVALYTYPQEPRNGPNGNLTAVPASSCAETSTLSTDGRMAGKHEVCHRTCGYKTYVLQNFSTTCGLLVFMFPDLTLSKSRNSYSHECAYVGQSIDEIVQVTDVVS
jgi:hypothetical protein